MRNKFIRNAVSGKELLVSIRKSFKEFVAFLFPPGIYCICCGDFINGNQLYSLCDVCVQKLHWILDYSCPKCGKQTKRVRLCSDCGESERSFRQGFACVTYGTLEKELVKKLKYKGKTYLGDILGQAMADRFSLEEIQPDLVVPVPIHKVRSRQRGYNQAALLAETVAGRLKVDLCDALVRMKNTKPMNRLSRVEREENVKNSFTLDTKCNKIIRDKIILLVDDVYTTGSTADACCRELLRCGASCIYLLVFAAGADRSNIEIA